MILQDLTPQCSPGKRPEQAGLWTNDFIERLEGQLKRLFKLKPKGRPKKKVDK